MRLDAIFSHIDHKGRCDHISAWKCDMVHTIVECDSASVVAVVAQSLECRSRLLGLDPWPRAGILEATIS